jgi:hypothetical protein
MTHSSVQSNERTNEDTGSSLHRWWTDGSRLHSDCWLVLFGPLNVFKNLQWVANSLKLGDFTYKCNTTLRLLLKSWKKCRSGKGHENWLSLWKRILRPWLHQPSIDPAHDLPNPDCVPKVSSPHRVPVSPALWSYISEHASWELSCHQSLPSYYFWHYYDVEKSHD